VDDEPLDELDDWQEQKQLRRRRTRIALGVGALVVALGVGWLVRPPPRPPPHTGAVLPVHDGDGSLREAVVVHSPAYAVSFYGLERLHPFDLHKYNKVAAGLVQRGLLEEEDFFRAPVATEAQLARVHDGGYLASLTEPAVLSTALEAPVPGFMGPQAIQRRILGSFAAAVGGTTLAARHAAEGRLAVHLGGGFHHARPAKGHGFCVYNDVAVAIAALRDSGVSSPVLIVDTDAHQGDGDHAFFAEDPSVFSLSLHQGGIFPHPKLPGDLDVPLAAGTGDETFLAALDDALDRVPAGLDVGLVVHVAGSDVLAGDPLADLAVTPEGLVRRDLRVARWARERGAGLLHLLAGGYGPRSAAAHEEAVAALLQGERAR